jgi:hypothetical protein
MNSHHIGDTVKNVYLLTTATDAQAIDWVTVGQLPVSYSPKRYVYKASFAINVSHNALPNVKVPY